MGDREEREEGKGSIVFGVFGVNEVETGGGGDVGRDQIGKQLLSGFWVGWIAGWDGGWWYLALCGLHSRG